MYRRRFNNRTSDWQRLTTATVGTRAITLPEAATDSGTAPALEGTLGLGAHGLKDNAGFGSAVV